MTDRPILRFQEPRASERRKGRPRNLPRAAGPGRNVQQNRYRATFERLSAALAARDPVSVLRSDPAGISPERALVFVTAGGIQSFSRAARSIGLEVFSETDLGSLDDIPEGFTPPLGANELPQTLYATLPTIDVLQRLLRLWSAYQGGEAAPYGLKPWWDAFDLLLDLRIWGPEDRLSASAREEIALLLPDDDDEHVFLELEIWPSSSTYNRAIWREETTRRVAELQGLVVDQSSISELGFFYEALLVSLPCSAVRDMLDNPSRVGGLAVLDGVQFVLPQTIAQAPPGEIEAAPAEHGDIDAINEGAPIRVALLDGTPMAGHEALDGGVVIEDVNDLVRFSQIESRYHATSMASLILRGDLNADSFPLNDSRILSVPVLIDSEGGAGSPQNRLFVDLIHTTLVQLFTQEPPLAQDVFVVNFSIGVVNMNFAGRMSALARLLDWWACREGVLFVISAGNVDSNLDLLGTRAIDFEDTDEGSQRRIVRDAARASSHVRTLLSPAEAVNSLTIGALSKDAVPNRPHPTARIFSLNSDDENIPQISSALGLGLNRSVKPDILEIGGRQEFSVWPAGDNSRLSVVTDGYRTGLTTASPRGGERGTQKVRGTSPAAALTTRSILLAGEALSAEGGPYEGLDLPRKTMALLGKALAVNSARWPAEAVDLFEAEKLLLGGNSHQRARENACKHFGYGPITSNMMFESPENGVTLVGTGTIRKDQSLVFNFPLPPSLSGERVPRSMRVTIAWFSPTNPARAQYRLASLEAVAAPGVDEDELEHWGLNLKSDGPDANLVKRGSVWSRRLVNRTASTPEYDGAFNIPICVQCRDAANGGLSPDDDIEFALVVTLEVEAEVQYDIHNEVEQKLRLRLNPAG